MLWCVFVCVGYGVCVVCLWGGGFVFGGKGFGGFVVRVGGVVVGMLGIYIYGIDGVIYINVVCELM